jgi:hypothetical protein
VKHLRLAHHHPGRIRVRAETLLDEAGFSRMAPVRESAGVLRVSHAPVTGSVVVEYDPNVTDSTALLDRLCELGGFEGVVDEAEDRGSRREPEQVVIRIAKGLNDAARELSQENADLKTLAPAALASAAVVSFFVSKHERTPRWDNLLWWSYSVFMDWHRAQIAAARK